MLKKGAIQEVSLSDQAFYSRLYLVPKKEGTYRPVIDLSSLNRFVPHVHFQTAPLFKDRSQERGPHDKYRSKRRIFFRSPLAPKGSSNPAHTNPEGPPVRLQLSSISQSPVSSRANLVAKQFTQGQRQPCFSPTTESHNSLRCFNARLACHVSGQVHKRQMVQSGINPAHQPPGIKSSISCPQNIPQGPVSQGCSIEVGQLHGSSLSQQQRRHPRSSSDVLNSGNRT